MTDQRSKSSVAPPKGGARLSSRLQAAARGLAALPVVGWIGRSAERASAVAAPPGKLTVNPRPTQPVRRTLDTLTIVSANLWHDWPRYRRQSQRLESLARMLEDERADILLLQEVARTGAVHVDAWLAQRLGMAHVYTRANGDAAAIGFEEGLAIMSRYPLADASSRNLRSGKNPFVRRMAIGAEVITPRGRLLAVSVHLGLVRRQNASQLEALRNWVAEIVGGRPALIGGDFNAGETSRQIGRAQRTWVDTYRHLNPAADGATHTLYWPWGGVLRRARLDYLFLHPGDRRWRPVASRHLTTPGAPHSDHQAVLVKLQHQPATTD